MLCGVAQTIMGPGDSVVRLHWASFLVNTVNDVLLEIDSWRKSRSSPLESESVHIWSHCLLMCLLDRFISTKCFISKFHLLIVFLFCCRKWSCPVSPAVTWDDAMIDPSSSEEETDEEAVEESHRHHKHNSSHQQPRAGKVAQDVAGSSANSFGASPGHGAGGSGPGGGPANASDKSWGGGGGATNSLDVPQSSGSLPR